MEAEVIHNRLGLRQMGLVYQVQSKYKDAGGAYTRAEAPFAALGVDSGRADAWHGGRWVM